MRAAYASKADPDHPLNALTVGQLPEPTPPDDWVVVDVRAASLNQHDLWSLRGVGLRA
ncbi:MAG: Zn-dependent oxidoreductase, partial [Aquihabitans sp.]